jgi:hypothetical protein
LLAFCSLQFQTSLNLAGPTTHNPAGQRQTATATMAMPPSTQALQKMNIPDLKDLLKFKGLPVGSNKAELIARLLKYRDK